MKPTIALIGALDTKGEEYAYVRSIIEEKGVATLLIDVGTQDAPAVEPDISRDDVVTRAKDTPPTEGLSSLGRGAALSLMAQGATTLLSELHASGRIDGVFAMGGTGGTSVATAAMRALPLGVPKVMVSTAAGGDVSGYVETSDIVMIPSIVDVAGINSVSRGVFARAAAAVCAMVQQQVPLGADRPLVVASMFGNTTPAVTRASEILGEAGYEVLVFHCTGQGGRVMEGLVEAGGIRGVLDLTTTELADELVGGVFSAGSSRLTAAARTGTPAIVVPGCLDMVNFWAPDTIPERFQGRTFYRHNENVTLMRTTPEENRTLGQEIARKVNASTGPVTVLLPLKGVSMIDGPDGAFFNPEANEALFSAIEEGLNEGVRLVKMDSFINDPEFASACATELIRLMEGRQ